MWLVYLRFDDKGEVQTCHVTAANKTTVDHIYDLAAQHGFSRTARLVEYAFFYARGTMKPKHVPNFHFYNKDEFINHWQNAEDEAL